MKKMKTRQKLRKKLKKRSFPKWGALLFLIFAASSAVVPALGMEMGGFDIEIGAGEANDFSSDWGSTSNGEGPSGEESSGGAETPPNEATFSDQSGNAASSNEAQGEPAQKPPVQIQPEQNTPAQRSPVQIQPEQSMPVQETPAQSSSSERNQTVSPENFGDRVQNSGQKDRKKTGQEAASGQQAEHMPHPTQSGSLTDKEASTAVLEAAVLTVTPAPSVSPTPVMTPIPTTVSAPAPKAEKKKTVSPTPVPQLLFYHQQSEEHRPKTQMHITHYEKEVTGICLTPAFSVTAQSSVHILSVRMNHKECPWHWQEGLLVLDQPAEAERNIIELIAICETESKPDVYLVE